jgi:hypothetical protein
MNNNYLGLPQPVSNPPNPVPSQLLPGFQNQSNFNMNPTFPTNSFGSINLGAFNFQTENVNSKFN